MSDDEEIRMGDFEKTPMMPMSDEELEISKLFREDLPRGLLPADSGWEFVKVTFPKALNAPEVLRIPIIAWDIGYDAALPIFPYPWSCPSKKSIEMETDYQAYLCPDGRVVGYHLIEETINLQTFVDICTRQEVVNGLYEENPDKDPVMPPLPLRFSR